MTVRGAKTEKADEKCRDEGEEGAREQDRGKIARTKDERCDRFK